MAGIKKIIADRFKSRYDIDIYSHVDSFKRIGDNLGQGFDFFPKDSKKLENALLATGAFILDDKRNLCDAVASAATNGRGYREKGVWPDKSLHCQIASKELKCNIHLDDTAFRAIGFNRIPYYNPDLGQHIGDDLLWTDKVVGKAYKKWYSLGWTLDRLHPILPHSSNKYKKIGGRVDLWKGENLSVRLEYTRSLTDLRSIRFGDPNPRYLDMGDIKSFGNAMVTTVPNELKMNTTFKLEYQW
ncbi:hypothetical protein J1N09_01780 [Aureitalea sp. L0-47]|uniref:hypothetical protein n=1 Tax=Aureitalea sp. L0-47 TaxID=2816962 RepID=UPI0022370FEF|nr:hypothetical protein [Aureitalea sp. L0-47]MCW5518551.1 hypothetical protein [Aureitalea sp. L0-47]